jgi:hypothetical protein
MRFAFIPLLVLSTSAYAEQAALKFDTEKLCQWQHDNNSMEVDECTKLEDEAKAKVTDLEAKSDAKRKEDCTTEATNFSVDSGFASYTLYAGCLKDGPGSL